MQNKLENRTHKELTNQSSDMNLKLTQILELVGKDIKIVIITVFYWFKS